MRARGVDDTGSACRIDELYCFARSIVGQAQNSDIALVERFASCLIILPTGIVQNEQLEFVTLDQSFAYFQARRSSGAIDEPRLQSVTGS